MGVTSRAGLPYPEAADPDMPRIDIGELAVATDAAFAMYDQGPLAGRPTSTPGSPGIEGRFYYATDNKVLYQDYGTGWTELNPDYPVTEMVKLRGLFTTAVVSGAGDQYAAYHGADQHRYRADGSPFSYTITAETGDNYYAMTTEAGVYRVTGQVRWPTSSAGRRVTSIVKWVSPAAPAAIAATETPASAVSAVQHNVSMEDYLLANTRIALLLFQDSGANQNLVVTPNSPSLTITKIGN